MRTRLRRRKDSWELRLPEWFIKQADLGDYVEVCVTEDGIVLSKAKNPREGWAREAEEMVARRR